MMIRKFRHILFLFELIIVIFGITHNVYAESIADCAGAKTASQADVGDPTKPETSGIFDVGVLEQMQGLMVDVYATLTQVTMFGHSLVCYAQTPHLGANKIDLVSWDVLNIGPSFYIWDFSMLFSGIIVFLVGVAMAYAIGMHFVDIAFKIGFAILFMPVTIALWPFKPTSQKFTDNLFSLIRNSMLFALVAIIVSFASELISQGLDLEDYWSLVSMGAAKSAQVKQTYDVTTTRFLTIAFVLIFSFKMLNSTIENVLNFFFTDPAFGSESPMHSMGTQAVGMAWQMTGGKALSYAGDVVKHTTGKAMISTGHTINRMRKGDFSDIKRVSAAAKSFGSAVVHPMRTTKRVASTVANSALRTAGSVAKDLHDFKALMKVGDFTEEEYRDKQASFNAKVDNFTGGGVREAAKQVTTAGITKGLNTARILRDTVKASVQSGSATEKAANIFSALQGQNSAKIESDQVRGVLHATHEVASQAAAGAQNWAKGKVQEAGTKAVEGMKNAASASVAGASQIVAATGLMDSASAMNIQQARAVLHSGKTNAQAFLQSKKQKLQAAGQAAAHYVDQHTQELQHGAKTTADWTKDKAQRAAKAFDSNQTNISLHPSAIISAPFKLAGGVKNTIVTLAKMQAKGLDVLDPNREQAMKDIWNKSDLKKVVDVAGQFAKETAQEYKNTEGSVGRKLAVGSGKVIIKKSGQIVTRTLKGTAQDAAGILSKVFIGFGKELADNSASKGGYQRWQEQQQEKELQEFEEQEERLRNQTYTED